MFVRLRLDLQLIEVKRGSWGLGAFTTQALRAIQPVGGEDLHESHGTVGLNSGRIRWGDLLSRGGCASQISTVWHDPSPV